jgi:hypothetical protein
MIEVELFDGTVLEFPEGTSQDVIQRVARERTAAIRGAATPEQPQQRTFGEALYENIIGSGEADTFGEKLGQYIRGGTAAVARGMADVPALPVNLAQLATAGVERALGMEQPSAVSRALESLPDTREMLAAVPIIGPESQYVAPDTAGQYISTAGEFAGGGGLLSGARSMLRYGALPGLASEAAGQATEGTVYEPYARTAAAIGTGLLATPRPTTYGRGALNIDDEAVRQAESLAARGIRPTAGQAANSPALMRLEGTQAPTGAQLDDLTAAALRTAGNTTARRATPEVLAKTQDNITGAMNQILDFDVPITPSVGTRALGVADEFISSTAGSNLPVRLRNVADEFLEYATRPSGGTIPASKMREFRTTLGRYTSSADEATRDAAHALRSIIDDASEETLRNIGRASDIETLATLRNQYRNYLTITNAASRGGREGARGILTPERLQSASSRVIGASQTATGRGTDLSELARTSVAQIGSQATTGAGSFRDIVSSGVLGLTGAGLSATSGDLSQILLSGALGASLPTAGRALSRSGAVQSILLDPRNFGISMPAQLPGLLSQ